MHIQTFLTGHGIAHRVLLHAPAPSASRLAHVVHVPGDRVAKGVLVWTPPGYALAVLPSTHRVDLSRLAAVLRALDIRLATEAEVSGVFHDCELGSIPPFGHLYGLPTVVDASLAGGAEIVVEGNARHEGIRLRYRDFEALEAPTRARFAVPIVQKGRRAVG